MNFEGPYLADWFVYNLFPCFDIVFTQSGFISRSRNTLREYCPNTEFFLVRIFLYSVQIQENTDQKNSVFGHYSHSCWISSRCRALFNYSSCNKKSSLTYIYLFKVNNRNTRKRCEICSKLTITTLERLSTVFIVNFMHILRLFSSIYSVDFGQVNICWVPTCQFINVEITYYWNCWQLYKSLGQIAAHKKRL